MSYVQPEDIVLAWAVVMAIHRDNQLNDDEQQARLWAFTEWEAERDPGGYRGSMPMDWAE